MKKILISFLSGLAFTLPVAFASVIQLSDIKPSDWFYEDVNNMVEWGVIQGNADGTFAPERNVNRAELSAMWNRYNSYVNQDSILAEYVVLLYGNEILSELDTMGGTYDGILDIYKPDFCKEGMIGKYYLDSAEEKIKKLKSDFPNGEFSAMDNAIALNKLLYCN